MKKPDFLHFIRLVFVALPMILGAATVQAQPSACIIEAVSGVSFGNYSVFSQTPEDATGSFTVSKCAQKSARYTATISTGNGSYATRTMTLVGGTETLSYNLYTSSTYATVWGDGNGGTGSVSGDGGTGKTSGTPTTIYGRIPAGQDVSAGSYSDSLTITITF